VSQFEEGLVVFSKQGFCPNCVKLRAKLQSKGAVYTEYKVDVDTEAYTFLRSKGFSSVPVMFLDGEVVNDI
jgi:glutaredoxin